MKRLLPILLLFLAFTARAATPITQLPSLNALLQRVGTVDASGKGETVGVLDGWNTNDWGGEQRFTYNPTSTAETNLLTGGVVFRAANGGRWISELATAREQDLRRWGGYPNTSDVSASLAAANAYCTTNGFRLVVPAGSYTNASTVNITCDFEMDSSATFWSLNPDINGIVLGANDAFGPTNVVIGKRMIVNTVRIPTTLRSHATNVGNAIVLAGLDSCEITMRQSDSYTYGVRVAPTNGYYCALNRINLPKTSNHRKGLVFSPGNYPCFITQNTFFNGEFYSPRSRVPASLQGYYTLTNLVTGGTTNYLCGTNYIGIEIDGAADNWTDSNNNIFIGTSVEGGAWIYDMQIRGRNNLFIGCRFEEGTGFSPRFRFWSDGTEAAPTQYNELVRGFFSQHAEPIVRYDGTAVPGNFGHEAWTIIAGNTPIPALSPLFSYNRPALSVYNASGGPALGVYEYGANPHQNPEEFSFGFKSGKMIARSFGETEPRIAMTTNGWLALRQPTATDMALTVHPGASTPSIGNWAVGLDATSIYLKRTNDPNPRIYLRGADGLLGWTDGTNPTDNTISRTGSGSLTVNLGPGSAVPGLATFNAANVDTGDSGAFFGAQAWGAEGLFGQYSANHSATLLKGRTVARTANSSDTGVLVWTPYKDQDINFATTDGGGNTVYSLTVNTNGIWTPRSVIVWTTNLLDEINRLQATKVDTNSFWPYLTNALVQGTNVNFVRDGVAKTITISGTATGSGGSVTNLGYLSLYSGGILASNTTTETTIWEATIPSNSITANLPIETTTFTLWHAKNAGSYTMRVYVGKSGVVTNKVFDGGGFANALGSDTTIVLNHEFSLKPKAAGLLDGVVLQRMNYSGALTAGFGSSATDGFLSVAGWTNAVWSATNDLYIKFTVQNSVASTNQWWEVQPGAIQTGAGGTTSSGGGSGSIVTVKSGSAMSTANFVASSEVDPTQAGANISLALVDGSIPTNRLAPAAISYLLNRGNHTGTEPWSVLTSTPTTRGGYGITDAQPLMGWTNVVAGTNISLSTNLNVLTIASTATVSGGGGAGTNIFVNNLLKQPARLTNSSTVTWTINGNGDIEAAASGGGGGGGSGTNAIVNGTLMQPFILTNDVSSTGRVVWRTNSSGHVLAYATNLPTAGSGMGTNLWVNNVLKQPARLTNSATMTWSINGNGDIEGAVPNAVGGPFLPLAAGYSSPLTGSLQVWPSTRGFVSLWNGTDTAVDAGALEMSSGHLKLEQVSTNSLAVLQTFLDIDMSTDPMVVDFPDNVGHRQVTFHAPTTFYNDVSFGTTNITTALANKQPLSANLTTLAGGNGSPITTGIAASAITSGTLTTNSLPATVAYTDVANTFTEAQAFSNAVSVGSMPLNYWFGSPMSIREWEKNRCTFNGSSVSTSFGGAALGQQNMTGGGGWSPTTSITPGHPGVAYVFTAASNAAGGVGSMCHWGFNTFFGLNPDAISVSVWQPYNTNGVSHRSGWDISLTPSDPTDAARWVATNGLMVAQNINNSVKVNGTNVIQLNGTYWYTTVISHSSNSPSAVFSIYTNGVFMLSETVAGFPTNRALGHVTGAYGFAAPATNSSIAVMLVDDVGYGISTRGYR